LPRKVNKVLKLYENHGIYTRGLFCADKTANYSTNNYLKALAYLFIGLILIKTLTCASLGIKLDLELWSLTISESQ